MATRLTTIALITPLSKRGYTSTAVAILVLRIGQLMAISFFPLPRSSRSENASGGRDRDDLRNFRFRGNRRHREGERPGIIARQNRHFGVDEEVLRDAVRLVRETAVIAKDQLDLL